MNSFNVCHVIGWDGRLGEYVRECIDDDIESLEMAIDDANEYHSNDGNHYIVTKGNIIFYETEKEDK